MIQSMKSSDEQSLLPFPIQKQANLNHLSDQELIYEAKLRWTQIINEAIAGRVTLTEENKHSLRRMNALAAELGYAPLFHPDFEKL